MATVKKIATAKKVPKSAPKKAAVKQPSKPAPTRKTVASAPVPVTAVGSRAAVLAALNASALFRSLLDAAEDQASASGWSFSSDCLNNHLSPFLEQGSAALFARGAGGDVSSLVAMETAARHIVSLMILDASSRGLPQLQEITFASARLRFCPCYPFC